MCFPAIGGLTSNITVIGDYEVRTTLLSKVGLRVQGCGREMINALNFFHHRSHVPRKCIGVLRYCVITPDTTSMPVCYLVCKALLLIAFHGVSN
jgi:hypothetical protein